MTYIPDDASDLLSGVTSPFSAESDAAPSDASPAVASAVRNYGTVPPPSPVPPVDATADLLDHSPMRASQPAQPQKPSLWKNLLAGALLGLVGGAGQKTFAGGVGAGGRYAADLRQQAEQNQLQALNQQSEIKFRDASTAARIADTALTNARLTALPDQLKHEADEYQIKVAGLLHDLGLLPSLIGDDNATTAKSALEMWTKQHGGVPPVSVLHIGGQLIGYAGAPPDRSLAPVNFGRKVMGQPPLSDNAWKALTPSQQENELHQNTLDFFVPQVKTTEEAAALAAQNSMLLKTRQLDLPDSDPDKAKIIDQLKARGAYIQALSGGILHAKLTEKQGEVNIAEGARERTEGRLQDRAANVEMNKRYDTFSRSYVQPLTKADQTFSQFATILDDANRGQMTGAESVVGLFNAIGISATPLKGMGFRINNNTVEEHATARGLGESLYQKLLRAKAGDVITPQQVADYAKLATGARHDMYMSAVDEAHRQGLPIDFLPKGRGRAIDHSTAKIYLDAYGDAPTAMSEAKKAGWQ
jgi:hypothetical protein